MQKEKVGHGVSGSADCERWPMIQHAPQGSGRIFSPLSSRSIGIVAFAKNLTFGAPALW